MQLEIVVGLPSCELGSTVLRSKGTIETCVTEVRAHFERLHPGVYFLDPRDEPGLGRYLGSRGILGDGEEVRALEDTVGGEMNRTVRVVTNRRSLIVKQSRPWVETDPAVSAPWDRALREMDFYELVADDPVVARGMPAVVHADRHARVLVLEDLGAGLELSCIYQGKVLLERTVDLLAEYLTALHGVLGRRPLPMSFRDGEVRAFNRSQVFFQSLRGDGGPQSGGLEPELAEAARQLREDAAFTGAVSRLAHEVHHGDGSSLVHGDFQPGSILQTRGGPRVIDPEFGYAGRGEYDVGVFLGHLLLARLPPQLAERFLGRYRPPRRWDELAALQLAGVEMMRRLIGPGRLPLGYGGEARRDLLGHARRLVVEPSRDLLEGP